jgi:hypothetical protein
VLSNPSYRDNARKLQKAIAAANGLSIAADLVEESLGVGRPSKSIRLTNHMGGGGRSANSTVS